MFIKWIKWFFSVKPEKVKPVMVVKYAKGKGGLYRWYAYLEDGMKAQCPVNGYHTLDELKHDVRRLFNDSFKVLLSEKPNRK